MLNLGLALTVAYDGTAFHGFQAQAGLRCVQSELARAAQQVCRHDVEIRGASRTDAGVHALGQLVALDTSRELSPRRWVQALNRYLPPDLAVTDAYPCEAGYQPRFDARDKLYRYVFHLGVSRDPLQRHRAWHLGRQIPFAFLDRDQVRGARHHLDLQAMHQATRALVGTHDFCAFRASTDTREDTIRTMLRVALLEDYQGDPYLLALEVEGTAFMKNMVRIMAGTLIAVGRRRLSTAQLPELLQAGADRRGLGDTAPPEGLTLIRVRTGRFHDPE